MPEACTARGFRYVLIGRLLRSVFRTLPFSLTFFPGFTIVRCK